MARIGIVIAVSEYQPPEQKLDACAKDGEAFSEVLKETGRFNEIMLLSSRDETASRAVKSSISSLVSRYKGQIIEEVVFYFSGHGAFSGDEFYHVLSDYDTNRKSQTTLPNSELDGLIRTLNPGLFVKVVDACHSGTSYIKGDDWTCNGFVPVTYLTMPPWPQMRGG